jgi:DNA-binding MarR family transcriptional regulator
MDPLVYSLLKSYPQIYLACHVDHVRKRSNEHELSSRDSSILSHLSETQFTRASVLAGHLGIVPSSLSSALRRLQDLGYIARGELADDRRIKHVTLTPRGAEAMAAISVLDSARVGELLKQLTPKQRRHSVYGLHLLAEAGRKLTKGRGGKKT